MASKLNNEQISLVLRMYAEGIGTTNIAKHVKKEFNIDYDRDYVYALTKSKKHQEELKRFKEDYMKRIKDVPIANKRIRIDDLEKVRTKIMQQIEENPLETKVNREEFRFLVRSLNDVIINAREEMEKKPFLMVGLGDFSDKSDDQLIAERDEILKQAERLVSGPIIDIGSSSTGTNDTGQTEPS